ncbi:MAG TPA: condensation domain-containing protein, partial [Ktedonobacteraceae bacterium]|nr:condensation domain-containing protein [Ktedonobacteraceae bacterium]
MQTEAFKRSPLSLQQARLWTMQQANQVVYRSLFMVLLRGQLHEEVLQQGLLHVVSRHEILHTVFDHLPEMDVPIQVVSQNVEISYRQDTFEGLGTSAQAVEIDKIFAAAREEPFDLAHGPLLRAHLLRLSTDKHLLLLSLPALCSDAFSLKLLVAELGQTYDAGLSKEVLDDEPLQYADVAAWQDELLCEEGSEQYQAYWKKIDLSQLAKMHLPFEQNSQISDTAFVPQYVEAVLEREVQAQLDVLLKEQQSTLEVYILTCWKLVLERLTGEVNSVLGVACNGRDYEELDNAIGLYTRFVPLCVELKRDQPFVELLASVHHILAEARRCQHYF